ncbi:MAG: J domain-containing protein [Proteobacteria bacterium]|nr:J domain-containing protein [Pseudomonadota bacterium]
MNIETSYKTLDLPPGSSLKDIKVAYLTKVKQYHPDRYTTETLNQHLAENKIREINLAYEILMTCFKDHYASKELPLSVIEISEKRRNRKKSSDYDAKDSENHPVSLKKARAVATKMALGDMEASHLFSISDSECKHARLKADSTIENKMAEISRTESDLTRYQAWLDNKYFKKNVYEISNDHKFKWKNLKKFLSGANPY